MTTSTASPMAETWRRYEAACDDLESARRTAAEARGCANEDRRALKEIEGRYVAEGVTVPEGVRDNAETRAAALALALRADSDYQSIAGNLTEHEQTALDAEIAAELHAFWLRGALRLMDHINATHGVERGA